MTARDRTRTHLLEAALTVWGEDPSASLGEVATTAGIGRTTLHRHFADRESLLRALDEYCRELYLAAVTRSRPTEDTGLDAHLRYCSELLGLGPVLTLIFADHPLVDPDQWNLEPSAVGRGLTDGSIRDLPEAWIDILTWTTVLAGWLHQKSGATRHEATNRVLDSMRRALEAHSG